jgi:hypothetical protein
MVPRSVKLILECMEPIRIKVKVHSVEVVVATEEVLITVKEVTVILEEAIGEVQSIIVGQLLMA